MDTKEEDILTTLHLPTFKWTSSFLFETIARKKEMIYKIFSFWRHLENTKLLIEHWLLDMAESISCILSYLNRTLSQFFPSYAHLNLY